MANQPRLQSRKRPPCGPIDVPAVWERIGTAVGTLAPTLAGNFARGATAEQIRAFEKALGRKLPEEVRQSLGAAPEFVRSHRRPGE
jgi:cell wall assembly regulator SMI1